MARGALAALACLLGAVMVMPSVAAKEILVGGKQLGWTNRAHPHTHTAAHTHARTHARTCVPRAASARSARADSPSVFPCFSVNVFLIAPLLRPYSETTYYPPIGADPGDTVTFSFAKGAHAVVSLPDEASWASCARPAFRLLASTQDTPFRFVVPPGPGTYYFACPVDNHCEEGMKVKVVATSTP
jgi:hypothetical protein